MNKTIIIYICIFTAIVFGNMYINKFKQKQKDIEIKGIESVLLKLNDNKTNIILNKIEPAKEIIEILPIEGKMKNAGGKLSIKLPKTINNTPEKITKVFKGDIMLEDDDKLIIYLEDQNVNKKYTKLGKVLLVDKLDKIKDEEEINIIISKNSQE